MQQSFFGVPASKHGEYAIYQDESGVDRKHDRFLLQGILCTPISKWKKHLDDLMDAREGYSGRIHFVDLRDNSSSGKAKAARNWLDLYFRSISSECPFKCLLADTFSSHEQITRHQRPFELYNYTTLLAIHGAISWSLTKHQTVDIAIYSEETSREPEDNFTSYVPNELYKRINVKHRTNRKTPLLSGLMRPIELVPGDPTRANEANAGHCQFIQLVDLLTGAVNQAVNALATQQIKIDLGSFVAAWVQDTRLPPWAQSRDLHRKFSVSCFPDSSGGFFNVPLTITTKGQIPIFE